MANKQDVTKPNVETKDLTTLTQSEKVAINSDVNAKQTAEQIVNEVKAKSSVIAEDVSSKTKEYAGVAYEKSMTFAANALDKAKAIADIASLKVKISGHKDIIKKNYTKLGEFYYLNNGEVDKEQVAEIIAELDLRHKTISECQSKIDSIKLS